METTKRITKHIDRLILDPNNYRFIDKSDYKPISDEQAIDSRIQQRTLNFLLGKNYQNIQDLIDSFTTNGFLDIDQIQVRRIEGEKEGEEKFLVIEGNRRVATLKYLWEKFNKGDDVGKLKEADFKSINLVKIENEDPAQHLITMGLHHISGKKRWSAVNEAQLISDLINKYNKTEEEVCQSLGISKHKLRRSLRTLSLVQQYKESDYGDQFQSNKYTIFETIVGNPAMKNWIEWNDLNYRAENKVNIEKLFEWISETEEIEEDEEGREQIIKKEPIINQYRQIKEIADFINDPVAIKQMEDSRSITKGYMYSSAIGESRLRNALENLKSEVQVAFNFNEYMTSDDYNEINNLKLKLDSLIPAGISKSIANSKLVKLTPTIKTHFTSIKINQYKKLKNFEIKNLTRVNIFVGMNNVGKTTLLEAFYLVSQLNNLNAFIELERFRGKFNESMNPIWLQENFKSPIDISANFNNKESKIHIKAEDDKEIFDKTSYITTIFTEAQASNERLSSNLCLFENKDPKLNYSTIKVLCRATFTSPYRYNSSLLEKAHAFAVEEKYIDEIIKFIKDNLDPKIKDINLISKYKENRFMVDSSLYDTATDFTEYGEGLQRVFEIALLIVYSRDGIICIDELDSAIHKSLLIKFTNFIQTLAEKYNVQVFLTTHNKECIDAFVQNEFPDDDLTAFVLTEDDDENIKYNFIKGNKLKKLVEVIDIDIR